VKPTGLTPLQTTDESIIEQKRTHLDQGPT
jgi:hypothetical protein